MFPSSIGLPAVPSAGRAWLRRSAPPPGTLSHKRRQRQTDGQTGRQAGRQAGRYIKKQSGGEAGMQADRQQPGRRAAHKITKDRRSTRGHPRKQLTAKRRGGDGDGGDLHHACLPNEIQQTWRRGTHQRADFTHAEACRRRIKIRIHRGVRKTPQGIKPRSSVETQRALYKER